MTSNPSEDLTMRHQSGRRSDMKAHERLKHLEDLVRNMVDNKVPAFVVPNSVPKMSATANDISSNAFVNHTPYEGNLGMTHWSEVLQHIHELKSDIAFTSGNAIVESIDTSEPDALFGAERPVSIESVLKNYLPPRVYVDRKGAFKLFYKIALTPPPTFPRV